ncbi:transcription factor jumonji [Cavenderia fasciculata]|uniref:Transcription factor jumonji n=1 Tax=Cavenderia fasciculata TaxID=261658 RepID=F4Q9D3_CACFS|nr:transcription factor jumonji [Cavenderia fasciculata]EGG15302.1 transcription factor jumonji [Cavenderia fasciculata]|eukprot:XP_004352022.1 transcription factor jumonji [Cavenderia fasciculata]
MVVKQKKVDVATTTTPTTTPTTTATTPAVVLRETLGDFDRLTDKMVMEDIFFQLTVEDLLVCQGVSSAFYVMLNDDRLWKDVFLRQIKGTKKQVQFVKSSWKLTALSFLFGENKTIESFPHRPLHFSTFQSMEIYTRWLRRHTAVSNYFTEEMSKVVDRRDVSELSLQEFIDRYERPVVPVIFTGVQKEWPAQKEWTKERLVERFGDITFKITHQDHKRIPMTFRDYARYMSEQCDEEPLYVFDDAFGEKAPDMLSEYSVPPYFPEDLFACSGEKERPHFRWIVIGPPRSGAPWHIDPAGTSAWNSLISGRKRWLMYPPQITPIGVSMEDIDEKFYGSPPSLLWLLEVYPYLPPDQKPIECIQNPGETIFVPGGWWHMVLNLEESIAVTQNFCDSQNFEQVCQELHSDGKEYGNFKKSLLESKPEFQKRFDDFELMESQVRHGFDNLEYWTPMIKELFRRHLPNQPLDDNTFKVESPISGQSPVFIVNSQYVVKFYCTEFGGEKSYLHESHLYTVIRQDDVLQSVFPRLLGNGYYVDGVNINYCDNLKWKWPYIVTSFIKGVNLQEVQIVPEQLEYPYPPPAVVEEDDDDEDEEDEEEDIPPVVDEKNLINLTADTLVRLHSIEPVIPTTDDNNLVTNPFITDKSDLWVSWKEELKNLYDKHIGNHWNWGGMPQHLRSSMAPYLPKDLNTIIDTRLPPCYLHTDLTDENVLGEVIHDQPTNADDKKKKKQLSLIRFLKKGLHMEEKRSSPHPSGLWVPKYMIDFGDSKFGDRWYELISLHLSVFAGDKQRFKQFLSSYTFSKRDGDSLAGKTWLWLYQQDPQAFIYRCMCYTIIHHCDAMTTITRHFPTYRNAKTIQEIAKLMYDLDYNPDPSTII